MDENVKRTTNFSTLWMVHSQNGNSLLKEAFFQFIGLPLQVVCSKWSFQSLKSKNFWRVIFIRLQYQAYIIKTLEFQWKEIIWHLRISNQPIVVIFQMSCWWPPFQLFWNLMVFLMKHIKNIICLPIFMWSKKRHQNFGNLHEKRISNHVKYRIETFQTLDFHWILWQSM